MHADFPSTLDAWLARIEACHPSEIDLGLDRIKQVADRLELDFSGSQVVTVAGTNGKGSTVTMLDAVLRQAGHSTGVYTSPHFLRYNERIRIRGEEASDARICQAFELIEAAREDVSLTYFEYGTLAALQCFAWEQPDFILLEVGLGGRLDAVNIVDSDVAVVTSIAIDHADWLGDDREQIGREKAGILRAGKPLVCGDMDPPESVRLLAEAGGAQLLVKGEAFSYAASADQWRWQGSDSQGSEVSYDNLVLPTLPLTNAATVLQVLNLLDIEIGREQINRGLELATMTGRMQRLSLDGCECVMDVAHNPEAANYLAGWLADHAPKGQTHFVIGMLADKDIKSVLNALAPQVGQWYLATLEGGRAATSSQLRELLPPQTGTAAHCFDNVADALSAARAAMVAGDRLVVAGSFFTVSDALAALKLEG
ncbi:bifunctional tetrahydrofolate synthase/dihydrofolate synthase [Marinobacterium sp. YM272]|uniref:bifunctional tetrahydrofolate synthase/dihydrofolate synthase n=1 Tax=Marinobacterium sp. YM272 TaxID=3421654 RepID=UPI003D7F3B51